MSRVALLFSSQKGEDSELAALLRRPDIQVTERHTFQEIKEELRSRTYDAFVRRCDIVGRPETEILRFLREHDLPTMAVVCPVRGSVADAVTIMKAGAGDFIINPSNDLTLAESILASVTRSPEHSRQEVSPLGIPADGPMLIGESKSIREMRFAISLVAKSETPVLITGESGTGKEVVARLIHRESNRADKAFVAINCAAFPKDVIENELFGHERGAFTGALGKKLGYFELADHGTLFFDEIAEMNVETQAKLLRAIETKAFHRLGGKGEIHVDIRTVGATNKDIPTSLKNGEFREDLYYRFSVIEICIPPLRERREDIPLLIEYFMQKFSLKHGKEPKRFSEECLSLFLEHDWRGNVRELQNLVERALIICPDEVITTSALPTKMWAENKPPNLINISVGSSTVDAERALILNTLASVGNNKSKAARILGVSRKTLHNKLRIFNGQSAKTG